MKCGHLDLADNSTVANRGHIPNMCVNGSQNAGALDSGSVGVAGMKAQLPQTRLASYQTMLSVPRPGRADVALAP